MIEINRFIKIEIYFAHFLALKMIEQSGGQTTAGKLACAERSSAQVMTIGNLSETLNAYKLLNKSEKDMMKEMLEFNNL